MVLRKTGDVWQKKRSLDSLGKILKRVKFFKTMMMKTSYKKSHHFNDLINDSLVDWNFSKGRKRNILV